MTKNRSLASLAILDHNSWVLGEHYFVATPLPAMKFFAADFGVNAVGIYHRQHGHRHTYTRKVHTADTALVLKLY